MLEFWENWHPFFWGIGKGFLLLGVALWIIIRKEKRLAAGWKKVDMNHPILPAVREIGLMLITMGGGALLVEEFGLNSTSLFLFGLFLMALGNWKVWIPPVKQSHSEITQDHLSSPQ